MFILVLCFFIVFVVLVWYLGNNGLGILFGKLLFFLWCILIIFSGIFNLINCFFNLLIMWFVVLLFELMINFIGLIFVGVI